MTNGERMEELKVLIRHRQRMLFHAAQDMQRVENELDTMFLDDIKKHSAKLDEYVSELEGLCHRDLNEQYLIADENAHNYGDPN